MELSVFGSSSKGNCYLLGSKDSYLIIEVGVPFKKVKPEIDFKISSIKGILVSHSHGDHSKYLKDYLHDEVPAYTYTSKETIKETGIVHRKLKAVEPGQQFKIDGFTVIPFENQHDVRCYGYLIHHKETGWVLFSTDTYYIKKKFKGLSHILIECNYDKEILAENVKNGSVPTFVKRRIRASHMELSTVQEMLNETDLSKVNDIVLLHLSDNNSDGPLFKDIIQKQTGIPVFIAKPKLKIELTKF